MIMSTITITVKESLALWDKDSLAYELAGGNLILRPDIKHWCLKYLSHPPLSSFHPRRNNLSNEEYVNSPAFVLTFYSEEEMISFKLKWL
jgi:hypothetical protein